MQNSFHFDINGKNIVHFHHMKESVVGKAKGMKSFETRLFHRENIISSINDSLPPSLSLSLSLSRLFYTLFH
jgi:hypothetical protein